MLSQLNRLTVKADGRYATSEELQFLKDYIQSFEQRINAYQKIQIAEAEILSQVEAKMLAANPNIFRKGNRNVTATCKRDRTHVLRRSAAILLTNDRDRLQNFLLWYQTIVNVFQDKTAAGLCYQIMQEVVKQHLTPQEATLVSPILELNHVILGKS